jgi:NADPH:quinone reductase
MQSWWIRSDAGKTLLEQRDVAPPKPSAGQVLVRVRAAALNRGEFIASLGLHAAGAAAKPAGQECAGEVIEVGEGVAAFRPGDRVIGRAASPSRRSSTSAKPWRRRRGSPGKRRRRRRSSTS